MEAANLGAYLAAHGAGELTAAIDRLAAAPDFPDHEPYTGGRAGRPRQAAERSRPPDRRRRACRIPDLAVRARAGEPVRGRIAKYFSNAIREDTILRLARGGIVFAPGRAGTVQEVFQAATKTFYRTDGASGPFVFLDAATGPTSAGASAAAPAAGRLPARRPAGLIHLTDDVAEAVALLTGG